MRRFVIASLELSVVTALSGCAMFFPGGTDEWTTHVRSDPRAPLDQKIIDAKLCTRICGRYAEECELEEEDDRIMAECSHEPAGGSWPGIEHSAQGPICDGLCGREAAGCAVGEREGSVFLYCAPRGQPGGRRPAELECAPSRAREAAGAWFASMAQLEAASVTAFTSLAEELAEHDAPQALLLAARRAARDEVRHADHMGDFARRLGAVPGDVTVAPRRERPLVDLAIENAVEGCVNEAFGAALMRWQALAAADLGTRAIFADIARDEAEHAALAFEINDWVAAGLSEAERAAVAAAKRDAIGALDRVDDEPSDVRRMLGLPDTNARSILLNSLKRTLWGS